MHVSIYWNQKATCSRVAVPAFDDEVRTAFLSNARRLASTWFGARKSLITRFGTKLENDLAAAGDNEEERQQYNDVAASSSFDRGKCRDIEWYLKNAALGSLVAPLIVNSTQFGILQVNLCDQHLVS